MLIRATILSLLVLAQPALAESFHVFIPSGKSVSAWNCQAPLLERASKIEDPNFDAFSRLVSENKIDQAKELFAAHSEKWFPEAFRLQTQYARTSPQMVRPEVLVDAQGKLRGLHFPTIMSFVTFFKTEMALDWFVAFEMDTLAIGFPRGGKETELMPEVEQIFGQLGDEANVSTLLFYGGKLKSGGAFPVEIFTSAVRSNPAFASKIKSLDLRAVYVETFPTLFPNLKSLSVAASIYTDKLFAAANSIPSLLPWRGGEFTLRNSFSQDELRNRRAPQVIKMSEHLRRALGIKGTDDPNEPFN